MTGASSYDEIPYTSYAYPFTHPDRLASIGRLFGMDPPDIAQARVLELGCASGGNSIPLAEQLPGARIVGVDLSGRQIAEGRSAIAALGLQNIELRHADLQEVDDDWGRFDYIVCHGVFSWVPRAVQDRILAICGRSLTPNGIAIISYNTYPGWHLRESVRDMMRYHAQQFADPHERTAQAGALVDFLVSATANDGELYGQLLRREVELLSRTSPEYLFHEHLEEHNEPCYFHQFAERLPAFRLQYLGEADVQAMFTTELPPDVVNTLGHISRNIVAMEQYLDFVRNRQFRQTLVCRAEIELGRALGPELVADFLIAFAGVGPACVDLDPGVPQSFVVSDALTVTSTEPVTKAAFAILLEHAPQAVPFEVLCEAVRARLGARGESPEAAFVREMLAVDLLACFLRGGIELRTWNAELVQQPGPRPLVSAYARWQATRGGFVTNRRHTRVDLDGAARQVVGLLDGTRSVDDVVDELARMTADGSVAIAGASTLDRPQLHEAVFRWLENLAAASLLVR